MGSGEEFGGTQMALVVGGLSLAEVYKVAIIAVAVVAGAISSYVGLTGLLWWCATIVIFLVINAIISGLRG